MKNEYKYELNQVVNVEGLDCKIVDRDYMENKPDYLCKPLDSTKLVKGQFRGEEGTAGWVREWDIKAMGGAE